MLTVIIPVLNESNTVADVIRFALRDPLVTEVIVVDDGSIDGTPDIARAAGATVITSTLLGKGSSMEDGLWLARNEFVVYLDGDLSGLHPDLIARLTEPLRGGNADFVKARFSRSAGRVTTLTARPMLRIFFPELAHIDQPLGGIIAVKRSLLRNLRFETDYGVDVGLLLDAAAAGAEIAEVDIGHIEHDSHPLEVLGDMATQVVRTILNRADRYNRFHMSHVREVEEVERRMQAELAVVTRRIGKVERLAVFDMDGVLIKGRYVQQLARRTNRSAELAEFLDHPTLDAVTRSEEIAALFAGTPLETFVQAAREMPLTPGAAETVVALRSAGFRVGILTDSYFVASEIIRRRVFADFSLGHLLKFRHGRATGELLLSPAMTHPEGCRVHEFCKQNALLHLLDKFEISPHQTLAVGDGDNDVCMLRAAGLGIAFEPRSNSVRRAANFMVGSLLDIPDLVERELGNKESTPPLAALSYA